MAERVSEEESRVEGGGESVPFSDRRQIKLGNKETSPQIYQRGMLQEYQWKHGIGGL